MNDQKQVLEIKRYPDAILRKKSVWVPEVTPREVKLLEDMLLTMYTFNGVGLAAPQIGNPLQLIVVDIGEGAIKLVNPRIIKSRGGDKMPEGCLSLPDINVEVERPYEVLIDGLDEKGQQVEIKAKGLFARVIQHEIDHLRGRLIIDYLGLIDKMKLYKLRMRQKR